MNRKIPAVKRCPFQNFSQNNASSQPGSRGIRPVRVYRITQSEEPHARFSFTVVILEFLIIISGRSILMFHRASEIILLVLAGENLSKDFIKARRKTGEKMMGRSLLVEKEESKGSHPVPLEPKRIKQRPVSHCQWPKTGASTCRDGCALKGIRVMFSTQ